MGLAETLSYWIFLPEIWLILAVVLIGADILFGFDFFVLSLGVAALILAGLLFGQESLWPDGPEIFETWRDIGLWFAGLSVAAILAIRVILYRGRRTGPDINEY